MRRPARRVVSGLAIFLLMTGARAGAADAPRLREAVRRVRFVQSPPPSSAPNDSGREGAIIGAVAGAGVMGTFFKVSYDRCRSCENDLPGWLPAFGVGLGATVGATLGYFVDKAHHGKRKVLVSPSLSPRRLGVRGAIRF